MAQNSKAFFSQKKKISTPKQIPNQIAIAAIATSDSINIT
jgi:hypothetical protein